jgi:hypothetical protein
VSTWKYPVTISQERRSESVDSPPLLHISGHSRHNSHPLRTKSPHFPPLFDITTSPLGHCRTIASRCARNGVECPGIAIGCCTISASGQQPDPSTERPRAHASPPAIPSERQIPALLASLPDQSECVALHSLATSASAPGALDGLSRNDLALRTLPLPSGMFTT